jgi:hypothetical protein
MVSSVSISWDPPTPELAGQDRPHFSEGAVEFVAETDCHLLGTNCVVSAAQAVYGEKKEPVRLAKRSDRG